MSRLDPERIFEDVARYYELGGSEGLPESEWTPKDDEKYCEEQLLNLGSLLLEIDSKPLPGTTDLFDPFSQE